jgi:hypothetical protein
MANTFRPPDTPTKWLAGILILACLAVIVYDQREHLEPPALIALIVMTCLGMLTPSIIGWSRNPPPQIPGPGGLPSEEDKRAPDTRR